MFHRSFISASTALSNLCNSEFAITVYFVSFIIINIFGLHQADRVSVQLKLKQNRRALYLIYYLYSK